MTKSSSKSKSGKTKKRKKRQYQRTTSVGRVCKNLERGIKTVVIAEERMEVWSHSLDVHITAALSATKEAVARLKTASTHMAKLREAGWAPPRKSLAVVFEKGDEIRISAKYRETYLKVYSKNVIEELTVAKVLDTGQIAVRHGRRTPFMAPKSHIEHRRIVEK